MDLPWMQICLAAFFATIVLMIIRIFSKVDDWPHIDAIDYLGSSFLLLLIICGIAYYERGQDKANPKSCPDQAEILKLQIELEKLKLQNQSSPAAPAADAVK